MVHLQQVYMMLPVYIKLLRYLAYLYIVISYSLFAFPCLPYTVLIKSSAQSIFNFLGPPWWRRVIFLPTQLLLHCYSYCALLMIKTVVLYVHVVQQLWYFTPGYQKVMHPLGTRKSLTCPPIHIVDIYLSSGWVPTYNTPIGSNHS